MEVRFVGTQDANWINVAKDATGVKLHCRMTVPGGTASEVVCRMNAVEAETVARLILTILGKA